MGGGRAREGEGMFRRRLVNLTFVREDHFAMGGASQAIPKRLQEPQKRKINRNISEALTIREAQEKE